MAESNAHRYQSCRFAYTPKTRTDFWLKKLESNVARDRQVLAELAELGWHVVTVWECELRTPEQLSKRLDEMLKGWHRDASDETERM